MQTNPNHQLFMSKAIELAVSNISQGGGPFGAVIIKDNKIIAEGTNQVTNYNDPTAHAEVQAIRQACEKLSTFELKGCTLYTSCEPCPMCLGAIYWARVDAVYYGANRKDAAKINFDDDLIYQEIDLHPSSRKLPFITIPTNDSLLPFETWEKYTNKTHY
ncbi:nucleoside deaminase [Oceanobacillus iheyensis]|uniref:Hypothetical conserved protein n=1 Tax=Oceanobacillus iheyensis (strain DSM 14371 / CIP 107618 / JCM 11309 / KCTC 3954 / HTE831) TaxID=221109 RepID=Q8ET78_OCEIH|nr:nucleoside deaminase [Oceanobacillus iheyensis]BAC12340.1 hypothetical conserved protein [Oceanobacillus iheyensis HTE831]